MIVIVIIRKLADHTDDENSVHNTSVVENKIKENGEFLSMFKKWCLVLHNNEGDNDFHNDTNDGDDYANNDSSVICVM